MFVISETDADAIRAAFRQGGEFSAAIELRRLFPGIPDNDQTRDCARTIAGWKPPLPVPLRPMKGGLKPRPPPCPFRSASDTRPSSATARNTGSLLTNFRRGKPRLASGNAEPVTG